MLCFEDEDLESEPCMAGVKKKSNQVQCAALRLKRARSRMKVIDTVVYDILM